MYPSKSLTFFHYSTLLTYCLTVETVIFEDQMELTRQSLFFHSTSHNLSSLVHQDTKIQYYFSWGTQWRRSVCQSIPRPRIHPSLLPQIQIQIKGNFGMQIGFLANFDILHVKMGLWEVKECQFKGDFLTIKIHFFRKSFWIIVISDKISLPEQNYLIWLCLLPIAQYGSQHVNSVNE